MMENTDDIIKLVTGNLDFNSRKEILQKIEKETNTREVFKKVKLAWALFSSTKKMPEYKIEKSYSELQAKILPKKPFLTLKIYSYLKYASILVIFLSISAVLFYLNKHNKAEITDETKYTSVVADYGQISKIILPDSSIIWLNSGTTLTYNNHYSVTNRDITLKGQAYLDVRKNEEIPLIVSCNELKVNVLGTKFDISAYPDDCKISVVLESGSIELLHSKNKSFSYRLKPGEMAEYDSQLRNIKINDIKPEKYVTWKEGRLIFSDTPMAEVIKKLERKFNIEIIVDNPNVYKSVFNANFKNESLIEILDYIQYSCPINYRILSENETIKSKIVLY